MSNSFGKKFKVTVFGQSHSEMMGVVIDGIPSGIKINRDLINHELYRRKPGKNKYSTPRNEDDSYSIVSGLVDGYTCGSALCALIKNENFRNKDYSNIKFNPRPSHADYPAFVKYSGFNDINGGGQFSGRLTAPLTIAGAIAKDLLKRKGIVVASHIKSIYKINDDCIDINNVDFNSLEKTVFKEFPVINDNAGKKMMELIERTGQNKDSVGGIIEVAVRGLPVGVGEPLYDSMESRISSAVFSVPGVRAIEFGLGFEAANLFGSEHNDEYYLDKGHVKTITNNHGGVIGGLSTGMPLIFRVAIKPTSSIGKEQKTVNLKTFEDSILKVEGRHDPCIVPRAVPVIEAVCAISILDLLMLGDFYAVR